MRRPWPTGGCRAKNKHIFLPHWIIFVENLPADDPVGNVLLGHFNSYRWVKYVVSKRRDQITHWRRFTSWKNGNLSTLLATLEVGLQINTFIAQCLVVSTVTSCGLTDGRQGIFISISGRWIRCYLILYTRENKLQQILVLTVPIAVELWRYKVCPF